MTTEPAKTDYAGLLHLISGVAKVIMDPVLCVIAVLCASHLIALNKLEGRAFLDVLPIVGLWLGNLYRDPPDRGRSAARVTQGPDAGSTVAVAGSAG